MVVVCAFCAIWVTKGMHPWRPLYVFHAWRWDDCEACLLYTDDMPLAIPPNQMQVTFHFATADTAGGEQACTLGVDCSGSSATDQQDLDAVALAFGNGPVANLSTNISLIHTSCLRNTPGGMLALDTTIGANSGDQTGGIMPINVAVLVRKVTGFAGRSNRGRLYLPGVGLASIPAGGGNFLGAGDLAGFQGQFNAFRAALVTAGLLPVIFHQAPASTSRAVTSFEVQSRLATQRGRLRD